MALGFVAATLMLGGCGAASVTATRPDMFATRKALVNELIRREDYTRAFPQVAALHRERPRDAEVLIMRGLIYRERGLLVEAEADLKEAIALKKNVAAAHAALAIVYDLTERGEPADAAHRRAVELAPQNPVYLNNLGFSLFLRGKHRDAVSVYLKAARLDPMNRRVRNNLGYAYARVGDLPRAAREFTLAGGAAEARNNLGYAYEQRGDMVRAFDLYVEALRLDPRLARARKNLDHAANALQRPIPADVPRAPSVVTENERSR
ncbi:MAG TPA: tetratricopeptide repeat protein [Polyangia bacterium]|jgi:Flp pilus assembly protein TadD